MSLPAIYLPHGGGPWPFVDVFGPKEAWASLDAYLRAVVNSLASRPKAILCVSAHWEESEPTLMTAERPPMLYDYYGFPEAAYRVEWPAPGAPHLEGRIRGLLAARGLPLRTDPKRGFDHGSFVPLKLAVPGADIPTTQLSLVKGLDPKKHLEIGRALAPLRDEGVLIVGSGMSYHNMRGFGSRAGYESAKVFDAWLAHALAQAPNDRARLLELWDEAPAARAAHPREEHLLPLHVVAGAGEKAAVTMPYRAPLLGVAVSAAHFH